MSVHTQISIFKEHNLLKVVMVSILVFMFAAQAYAFVSGEQLWAKRYNYSGLDDTARNIVTDKNNNVYVLGQSGQDYALAKYDAAGNQKWVKRYNGPAGGSDIPSSLAVDKNSNVYVTGGSESSKGSGNYDYATVKYNTYGTRKWVKRYNGPGSKSDFASDIKVDSNNNVYVTGSSYGGATTKEDYATIKYDTYGNQKWVRRYNGSNNLYDGGSVIAIDSNGNIIVSGTTMFVMDMGGSDVATIKYSPTGTRKWVKKYRADGVSGIITDKANSIYILVAPTGDMGFSGYGILVKYDLYGNKKWGKSAPEAAVTIDSNNNIYVAGSGSEAADFSDQSDFKTVKFNTAGTQQWARYYSGPDFDSANAITVDSSGNIYVTGSSFNASSNPDYATVKYDSAGNQGWVSRYNGSANKADQPYGIATDTNGNILVTGSSYNSSNNSDFATVKYAP